MKSVTEKSYQAKLPLAHQKKHAFVKAAALVATITALMLALTGCSSSSSDSQDSGTEEKQTIRISAIAREEPEIQWLADYLGDKYDIEPVIFSDNVSVNESLVDGSVDLNYFQNANYLENTFNKANGTDLQAYGDGIFYMPYVLMSRDYDSLDDIKDGSTVLIGNAASTTATELKFLEQAGLIELDPAATQPTIYDVVSNPKNLEFILIENRSRVGAYDDADLMPAEAMNVVNMNRADADINDALYVEDASERNKYEHDVVITVRKETAEENPQWLQDIDAAWHSQDFKTWLEETYAGGKVAAF